MLIFSSCAIVQSVVKSTFPYTATVLILQSSKIGVEQSATGTASSFDQSVTKNGNNGKRVKDVHIVSAKLIAKDPSDFNIGNLVSVKVYLSKADGTGEVLVATRNDVLADAGRKIVLDIDNSSFLDELVHEGKMKTRMTYKLRNHIDVNAGMELILGLRANPGE